VSRARRQGVEEALALLEGPDGLIVAEPGPTMMSLVAQGVNACALLLAERHDEALESARKCVALVAKQSDDAIAFARAMDGHAHAAVVLTRLFELRRDGAPGTASLPPPGELERDAVRAAAGLRRLAARWPAARPISALIEAYQLRLRGKKAASATALDRASETARGMSQSFERAVALRALAREHGRSSTELGDLVAMHGLGGVEADRFPV
jgi:hypothetical protein